MRDNHGLARTRAVNCLVLNMARIVPCSLGMKIRHLVFAPAVSAIVLVSACASSPTPTARVASAEAAIRAADESGAKNTPNAALHLHYAEQQRVEAQRLMRKGDNEQAAMQFRRAEADANLALALAHEAEARHAAQNATDALGPERGGVEKNNLSERSR